MQQSQTTDLDKTDESYADSLVRKTLEGMLLELEEKRKNPEPVREVDYDNPIGLTFAELQDDRVGSPLYLGHRTHPIWALEHVREINAQTRQAPHFIERFYKNRGRHYFDELTQYDVIGAAGSEYPYYPAMYRSPSGPAFGAYSPVYESHWFTPLMRRPFFLPTVESESLNRCMVSPTSLSQILPTDCQFCYRDADGNHADRIYTRKRVYDDDGFFKDESEVDPMVEMQFAYVGLNTFQRAVVLHAVNNILIPLLNVAPSESDLYLFLPNMLGKFGGFDEWADNNDVSPYQDNEPYAEQFKKVHDHLARIFNKSILLRYMLRTQKIPEHYRSDMSNAQMITLIDTLRNYMDVWKIPAWDDFVVPSNPAAHFMDMAMPERGARIPRMFGRGALWDRAGKPRAGLMTVFDIQMMLDALTLVLKLHNLFAIGGDNFRTSDWGYGEASLDDIADYLGGIGILHKSESLARHLTDPDWRDNINTTVDELIKEDWSRNNFYEYSNRDIAEFVYAEVEDLYENDVPVFKEALLEHYKVLKQRIFEDPRLQERVEGGYMATFSEVYSEKSGQLIHLPLGYTVTYRDYMIAVESLLKGLKGHIYDTAPDTVNPEEIQWYHDTLHPDGGGVLYGDMLIQRMILQLPDDPLCGKDPYEVLPIIEDTATAFFNPMRDPNYKPRQYESVDLEPHEQSIGKRQP